MKKEIILVIALIQIVLLLGLTFADSYQIKQMNKKEVFGINLKKDNLKSLVRSSLNLLVGFLAIEQIGIVSAEQAGGYCCEKTEAGAYCQNTEGPEECDMGYKNSPTTCDLTTYCKPGCCYDPGQGICLNGAPEKQCVNSGGEWKATCEEESRCGKGCCILGSNTQFTTRAHCRIISESQGAQVNFDPAMTEEDCKYYSPEEGACLIGDGSCRRTNEEECKGIEGSFNKGHLCSYFDNGAGCKKTDHIGCSDKENQYDIFWFDSCGNRENVYLGNSESAKTASWAGGIIKKKSELPSCSGKDCGKCDYEGGKSICASSKSTTDRVQAGDFYCKDLTCVADKNDDGKSEKVKNGESWCVYDGKSDKLQSGWVGTDPNQDFFGGRDAVGAGHFIRYCDQGEIKTDPCGTGDRGEICAQISYEDGTVRAQCRTNLWFNCFSVTDQETCEASPNVDCRWEGVKVDKYFDFGACVPKFPKGFNLAGDSDQQTTDTETGTSKEQDLCGFASKKCTIIEARKTIGAVTDWFCVANCECLSNEFLENMNNFCVSLGDCGAYYNVEGDYTSKGFDFKKSGGVIRDDQGDPGIISDDIKKSDANDYLEKKYKSLGDKENTFDGDDKNIPEWMAIDSSEGTYEDLSVQGELDPNLENKIKRLQNDIANTYIGLGVVGAAAALAGYLLFPAIVVAVHAAMAGIGLAAAAATVTSLVAGGGAATTTAGTIFGAACGVACGTGIGAIAVAVAVIITLIVLYSLNLGETREKTVEFKCMPWQPPISTGDAQCEKCNDNELGTPCTKYKCESLGSGCRLIDQEGAAGSSGENGTNNDIPEIDNPVCIDMGKCGYGGSNPPERKLVFVSSGFTFSQSGTSATVKKSNGEAVRESDIINLTLETNDYAFCKYNYYMRDYATFDLEGEYFNEGNYHTMNHTLSITIPWIEDERVQNNSADELRLFVRCIDKCDKYLNTDEYIISFPINPSPDTTAPMILNITPADPSYLPFGVNQSFLRVITNELSTCKYDFNQGIQFGFMAGNLTQGPDSQNGEEFYSEGVISGLVGNSTTIYIKCSDQHGNNQTEDTLHTFLPTPAKLEITDYKPQNEYVRKKPITTEEPLVFSVTTAGGAFGGNTECIWELKGATVATDSFLQNQSVNHEYLIKSQLQTGEHQLKYTCWDAAYNFANITTNFTIEDDKTPPVVTRIFIEGSSIKVLTNENARCFYNTTYVANCNFEQGTGMDSLFTIDHSISYQYDQTYYIKCKDEFNNQNNKCAVIVRPGVF